VITPTIRRLVTECVSVGESVLDTLRHVEAHTGRHGNLLTFGDAIEVVRQHQEMQAPAAPESTGG
jgi:hypothetical protein